MSSDEETKHVEDQAEKSDVEKKEETFPKPEAPAPKAKPVRSQAEIMKEQEAKLRMKYPALGGHVGVGGRPGGGGSALLHKRLSKGTKYFDSGDYNMAKSKKSTTPMQPGAKLLISDESYDQTGEEIARPDNVSERKLSLCQPTHVGHHFDQMITPKMS